MRPIYQAFATMDGREWLVLWRGEPGDSAELVARLAAMRIARFELIPGEKRVELAQSLCVFPRSIARRLTLLRRYIDNHLHGPPIDSGMWNGGPVRRGKIIRGPWQERSA